MSQNQSSSTSPAQSANPAGSATTTTESGQTFRPVETGQETASGEILLIEAYAIIWLLAFGLIVMSIRRQRQLDARIAQLNGDLAKIRERADGDD